MTFSNGAYNPHPLANPFNTRLGPANYSLNPNGESYHRNIMRNDKNASLPDAMSYAPPTLEVPNQLDYDIGVTKIDRIALSQMYKNAYVAPDGTVFDLDSRKIVMQPMRQTKSGEWENTSRVIEMNDPYGDWNNAEIYRLPSQSNCNQLDEVSIKYWQQVEQSKPTQMSELQRELLADLDAGKLTVKSKLVDC